MIKLDFLGSTHGNFLEYVTNVYIMQTSPSATDIFRKDTQSAHGADNVYRKNRQVVCGHYSESPLHVFKPDDTVIQIDFDQNNDRLFYISLTNLMHKTLGIDRMLESTSEHIRNNPPAHRREWLQRIVQKSKRSSHSPYRPQLDKPDGLVYVFPMEAFYDLHMFHAHLQNLAYSLNQKFRPCQDLDDLWYRFIELNQGLQSYNKCSTILENIHQGANYNFVCDSIIEEAWLNYNLSNTYSMHEGTLFDIEQYPTNTREIYNILKQEEFFS